MFESEKEESKRASRWKCEMKREVRMVESETIKYMLYGEGKIETTMRGGEGHEMSEEVSVRRYVACEAW